MFTFERTFKLYPSAVTRGLNDFCSIFVTMVMWLTCTASCHNQGFPWKIPEIQLNCWIHNQVEMCHQQQNAKKTNKLMKDIKMEWGTDYEFRTFFNSTYIFWAIRHFSRLRMAHNHTFRKLGLDAFDVIVGTHFSTMKGSYHTEEHFQQ